LATGTAGTSKCGAWENKKVIMGSNPDANHSVLFVCTANQCRSPMAEVIFKQSLVDNGYDLDKWQIESAGCWAYDGLSATDTAVLAASEMGLDLTNHNSRGISESLLDRFNLILCMEFDHKRTLQRNFTEAKERIFLLSEMADEEKEIDDPVGLSLEAYLDTTDEIRGYLDTGMEKIFQLSA